MKHAGEAALDALEPLLAELRALPLKEKKRGIFYKKSSAFLHFHEDEAGLFADLMGIGRYRVSTEVERKKFLAAAKKAAK